jgi:hypothetical protein
MSIDRLIEIWKANGFWNGNIDGFGLSNVWFPSMSERELHGGGIDDLVRSSNFGFYFKIFSSFNLFCKW